MSTDLEKEVLYIPRISGGSPLSGQISLGFLVITESKLFYIPVHIQELKSEQSPKMHITDVRTYDDISLWEVIEQKARVLTPLELNNYVATMAKEIEGSKTIARESIISVKVGLMKFTVLTRQESFSLNLGIAPRKRKKLKTFLSHKQKSHDLFEPPPGQPGLGVSTAVAAGCAMLLISIGYVGTEEETLPSLRDARAQITQSQAILEQARDSQAEANTFLNQASALKRQGENLFLELKLKKESGEQIAELKRVAKRIRDLETKEDFARKRACELRVEQQRLELQAYTISLEAHRIVRELAKTPKVDQIIDNQQSKVAEINRRLQAKERC